MLDITPAISIPEREITVDAVRAQGAGGQHVNKVSSAVHLRFDIPASSLPADIKARLLECRDRRISGDGVLVIKAQRHRTQERNLEDARERLRELVLAAIHVPKTRKATRPTRAAHVRRLAAKAHRARVKILRGRTDD